MYPHQRLALEKIKQRLKLIELLYAKPNALLIRKNLKDIERADIAIHNQEMS